MWPTVKAGKLSTQTGCLHKKNRLGLQEGAPEGQSRKEAAME